MKKKHFKKAILSTSIGLCAIYLTIKRIAKKQKPRSIYEDLPEQKNPMEGKQVIFVPNDHDPINGDGLKGHLEPVGVTNPKKDPYNRIIKPAIDEILAFGGLVSLSPLFFVLSVAIQVDDPGSVIFTQKRVGENKQYFKMHKFRTMRMDTPHDVPTHMLDNPEKYITRVGRFMRKHSLDELPQIWDIFMHNMSVIGPRPALWNQDFLTAERDKYKANDVKPGLTGWAQINGRDELEIPHKAKLDGEYIKNQSLIFDIRCFLDSIHVFKEDDSVVEGGTGEMKKSEKKKIVE